jgi:hypothetical protein
MQLAGEQIAVLQGVGALTAVQVVGKEAAAQLCPQGLERQLIYSRLTRRKYTVRLTKMPSNNMKALQRDEEVSVKAKNRLLTRSLGLL